MRPSIILFLILLLSATASGRSFYSRNSGNDNNSVPQTDTIKSRQPSNKQPVYTTQRLLTSPPVIDGKLDDACWKKGTWAGNFHQLFPNEGARPTYPTELNIQYSDDCLYVAIMAFDGEPGKILRMAGERDEFAGDMVGITFDSYRNYKTGFEFTVTA